LLPEQVQKTVTSLSDRLRARQGDIATDVAYYKGTEGRLRFVSDEFRDYFAKRFDGLSDNWCAPVAQAPVERMRYLGMRLPDTQRADEGLMRTWEANDAARGLSEALLMMVVARRSFALVSPVEGERARITFEHPDSAIVDYDPITRQRRAGLVIWQDDANEYAELSGLQTVTRLRRPKLAVVGGERRVAPDAREWQLNGDPRKNPLGAVPLVEFRNSQLLDNDPASDIEVVRSIQDTINLVWAYMLNALDYATLPQRVAMADSPTEPILDEETGEEIGDRPVELDRLIKERIMFLGEGAQIAEWTAASPTAFVEVVELGKQHIAAQTRTPSHYLVEGGSNIPAAGYQLAEAGLVSKTNERIGYATPAVREINRLVAVAEGKAQLAEQIVNGGRPMWAKPQYRSEEQLMDGLQKMRDIGFPIRWIAEEYGLGPNDVDRVMDMIAQEQQELYGGYPAMIGAGSGGGADDTAGG